MASSVLTLEVEAQNNSVLSWRSELVPYSIKEQDPGLLDISANGVVPLARVIREISYRVEEERVI